MLIAFSRGCRAHLVLGVLDQLKRVHQHSACDVLRDDLERLGVERLLLLVPLLVQPHLALFDLGTRLHDVHLDSYAHAFVRSSAIVDGAVEHVHDRRDAAHTSRGDRVGRHAEKKERHCSDRDMRSSIPAWRE